MFQDSLLFGPLFFRFTAWVSEKGCVLTLAEILMFKGLCCAAAVSFT